MNRTYVSLVSALALSIASSASGFDMTGTYEATYKCKMVNGDAKVTIECGDSCIAAVLQTGTSIAMTIDGAPYVGIAYPSASTPDKGTAALEYCLNGPGSPVNDEVISFKVKTVPSKGKATLKGKSFWHPGAPSGIGFCTYTLKRISTDRLAMPLETACTTGGRRTYRSPSAPMSSGNPRTI